MGHSLQPTHKLRRGDTVEVRPGPEILATLDSSGTLDGVPFMPEMLNYIGGNYKVAARVERACDTIETGIARRMPDTVVLQGVRCNGAAHGGCQAGCVVYWKEAWLRPVSADEPPAVERPRQRGAELEQLVFSHTEVAGASPTQYKCQATEFLHATQHLGVWDARSFARELTTRNVRSWVFLRVCVRAILEGMRKSVGRWGDPVSPTVGARKPPPDLGLKPGDVVRVRSKDEIMSTLDAMHKTRGLWFDREMLPYCGSTHRVIARVQHFINEKSGEMIDLKTDALILDNVVCGGLDSPGRWFCPRAIYSWWREDWLEPVEQNRAATNRLGEQS